MQVCILDVPAGVSGGAEPEVDGVVDAGSGEGVGTCCEGVDVAFVVEGEVSFELVVWGIVDLDESFAVVDWVAYSADGVGYSLVAGPLRFVEDGVEVAVFVVEVGSCFAGVVGPLETLVRAGWWR